MKYLSIINTSKRNMNNEELMYATIINLKEGTRISFRAHTKAEIELAMQILHPDPDDFIIYKNDNVFRVNFIHGYEQASFTSALSDILILKDTLNPIKEKAPKKPITEKKETQKPKEKPETKKKK